MKQVEIEKLILENGFELEDKEGNKSYEYGTGDIFRISQLLVENLTIPDVSGSYDSKQCSECGGRTALITGNFTYDADSEPYNNGVEEEAKIESSDCWVGGFKCDDCGHVQGLWHE